jgi:hypothetical protein
MVAPGRYHCLIPLAVRALASQSSSIARAIGEGEGPDLREVSAAFLLEKAQRLTEEEIRRTFPLPITWVQFYERQPGWDWPEND